MLLILIALTLTVLRSQFHVIDVLVDLGLPFVWLWMAQKEYSLVPRNKALFQGSVGILIWATANVVDEYLITFPLVLEGLNTLLLLVSIATFLLGTFIRHREEKNAKITG